MGLFKIQKKINFLHSKGNQIWKLDHNKNNKQ